jgi:septum formation protein
MSKEEILAYVETGDCMDKAGSYGIQGAFAAYIKGIKGDYNNVVGLPVAAVHRHLKEMIQAGNMNEA